VKIQGIPELQPGFGASVAWFGQTAVRVSGPRLITLLLGLRWMVLDFFLSS